MKLSVYYDEIDGQLHPQWMLIPCNTSEEYLSVTVDAPFERFWPEDFHDSLSVVTVTQATLVREPDNEKSFFIHLPSLLNDLESQDLNTDLSNVTYFLIRMEDLEELLQMNVRELYI